MDDREIAVRQVQALQRLNEELRARHAPPFAPCFMDEHWHVIERVLDLMRRVPECRR